jgi:polysaccharide deacetylase family protein (PEP-CTERM system associated)
MTSSSPQGFSTLRNILTVDLEEWFHSNLRGWTFTEGGTYEVRVVGNTHRLLEVLEEHHAKATFFVLGSLADDHPELVRQIAAAGHEIATHGYAHRLVYEQTPDEFRDDVARAKARIEDIIGRRVKGYRAPSWSINEGTLWALELLEELGFAYDASVFPMRTYLYGMPSAPRFPYRPVLDGRTLGLLEVPASTVRLVGCNLPFAGGFYFRALPFLLFSLGVRSVNQEGHPAIVYLHPREIDPGQPRLRLPLKERVIHHYGVRRCEHKLIRALRRFEFTSIEECLSIG